MERRQTSERTCQGTNKSGRRSNGFRSLVQQLKTRTTQILSTLQTSFGPILGKTFGGKIPIYMTQIERFKHTDFEIYSKQRFVGKEKRVGVSSETPIFLL